MQVLLHLMAAVALLVWGTHIVRTGVLRVYGARLRHWLSHYLDRRLLAFAAGTGVTALVQSSNATALLVSGFVADGLMPLATGLAILLGADLGTALMARVLTLDLSWLSPLLLIVGVPLFLSRKQSKAGQLARVALGLGLMLLALTLIIEAMAPVTEARGVRVLFESLTGDLLLDAVVGALFAMLTYSSLAAVLLTATLSAAGVLSLPVALCLVMGATVGSGVLAFLNSGFYHTAGRRVALGSLLFKLAGLILMLPFVDLTARWLATLSFAPQDLVIGFYLAYNGGRCLTMLPLTVPMARLCRLLLPDPATPEPRQGPRHLDPQALDQPALALANASREVLAMGDLVETMLDELGNAMRRETTRPKAPPEPLDDQLDSLHTAIKLYLARLPRERLSPDSQRRWSQVLEMSIGLEQAGDLIERMMEKVRDRKTARRRSFSRSGLQELLELHERLRANLRLGLSVFLNDDEDSIRRLLEEKSRFQARQRQLAHAHLERLRHQVVQSLETSSLHLDLLGDMKRLNSLFCAATLKPVDKERPTGESRS
ncbi:putative Na+/Pi symporter [Alcanivorax balearicus MACL04]|uniref:Na+/Pi symporter n=1 Tax=Alloalcanivorax balearicus MACL04 TaxID=1177182 RepID=A0ABT2R4P9_9GAMM|nr:Na/Pi cotransporter family protein [Alloalcanivorax balearicus]MCU5784757.1 putative Na+/Pi symporter [Alloalcanivorax balearicus MACL04]